MRVLCLLRSEDRGDREDWSGAESVGEATAEQAADPTDNEYGAERRAERGGAPSRGVSDRVDQRAEGVVRDAVGDDCCDAQGTDPAQRGRRSRPRVRE